MKKPRDIKSRILNKINIDSKTECWVWTGAIFKKPYGSYGQLRMGGRIGKLVKAHRVSYEFFVGKYDSDLELDHLCHNTLCVNPKHLEPVTHTENMQRRKDSKLPYCRHGHLYTPETTFIRTDNGRRECKICRSIRVKRYKQKVV